MERFYTNCEKGINSCNSCPVVGLAAEHLVTNSNKPVNELLETVAKSRCFPGKTPIIEGNPRDLAIKYVRLVRDQEILGTAEAAI